MPAVIQEVKWGEDNPIEVAPVLSEEEKDALQKRMKAMDKLLADAQKAKYKIELFMNGKERAANRPYAGALSLWESGARLHGGGDDKVYECPSNAVLRVPCSGIIGGSNQGYGHLVCPTCQKVWRSDQVHGEILARLTTQNWAALTFKYFGRLGFNADIYLKYMTYNLHVASDMEQARQLGGEKLERVRGKRMKVIYPLKNIIKDTNAGKDMLACLRSFLSA